VGSSGFHETDWHHRRTEIGATWVTPARQRTAINTEAKYLMLRHAFEDRGLLRVEFKTDSLNTKSRAALARIGATEEGTFRNHMVMPDGRSRHSVYFSIIAAEWPAVKERLERSLSR
jgi:RimJ/RimL family protein N-acetyltransferase